MSDLTYEKIANAIKATDYKYFGDYELSVKQREAVETLVDASVELMSFSERSDRAPQSEWISVDDRYPQVEGIYLVCLSIGSVHVEKKSSAWRISRTDISRKNTNLGDWIRLTHWMPLPNPPEAK